MNTSNFRKPVGALVLALAMIAAQGAMAQVSTGGIAGHGATGDTVTLRNVDTNFQRELKVDDKGRFRMGRLPIGLYEVVIRHADGSEERIVARVSLGSVTRVK